MNVEVNWRLIYWWVVPLIAGVSAGDPPWSCPLRCECLHEILVINCSSRQLSSVPEGINTSTQSLSLSDNLLRKVGHHQFLDLAQLQKLDLSRNLLTVIEVEAFVGLQNLQTLQISQNRLKILLVGVFSGLQSLQMLDISRNEILVLLNDMFNEMPSLEKLEAGENELVFISNRAFKGIPNLQELSIDGYNLSSFPSESFSQLTNLVKLRFFNTGLTTIPNNSFRRMTRLRELTISQWPWLDSLASNSLFGLNLTSLTLSSCNLNIVPNVPLRHLVFLRYLDLSYNPITSIQSDLLSDLVQLQEFHLVGGSLLRLEPAAFRGLVHLRLLNVSLNKLSTLEETVFQSVQTLKVLRLDGNPLACDCRLFWVLNRRLQLNFDQQSPDCTSPVHIKGRRFHEFSDSELAGSFVCRQAHILNHWPQEVNTDEGQTVLLFCQVDGEPVPSVSWVSPKRTLLSSTGRIQILPSGSLEVRYAQVQDSGFYQCFVSNVAGNDSISVSLRVRAVPATASKNRSANYILEGRSLTSTQIPVNGTNDFETFPFDLKTLLVTVMMGFLSFLSSVAICFVFMFLWSQSKGKIKRTATIDFVPHTAGTGSTGGRTRMETGRFTMKLI